MKQSHLSRLHLKHCLISATTGSQPPGVLHPKHSRLAQRPQQPRLCAQLRQRRWWAGNNRHSAAHSRLLWVPGVVPLCPCWVALSALKRFQHRPQSAATPSFQPQLWHGVSSEGTLGVWVPQHSGQLWRWLFICLFCIPQHPGQLWRWLFTCLFCIPQHLGQLWRWLFTCCCIFFRGPSLQCSD